MLFLILSVICSVSVGVIFKIARGYSINVPQIVAANYFMAVALCYFFFSPTIAEVEVNAPWGIYIPLGILLPFIFLFLAASIKQIGIVKTDAAQRLSLFIPILAAWLLFDEKFNAIKITAFLIAFPALLLILNKPSEQTKNNWIYPAVVLFGFGIIDILFKQIALYSNLPFTTSLFVVFGLSMIIMMAVVLFEIGLKKVKLKYKNLLFGSLVGLFNFGNILFYLKAHQAFSENPSTVFAGMNLGVIFIGSLTGIYVFKEKLSKFNYAGLVLALVAIVLIVISQQ